MVKQKTHRRRVVMLGLALAAFAVVMTGAVVGMASPSAYTFSGSPSAPLAAGAPGAAGAGLLAHMDVQVHSRDSNTWYQLEPMDAEHGPDCAGPPATHHETGSYADAVFQCKDHLMTSINATGYGEIMLTPDQMVDFSKGGTVSFDVSTERMSLRDWWDVWVTPWSDNVALPFDMGEVDLQGPPKNAVQVSISDAQSSPIASVIRNGAKSDLNAPEQTASVQDGITAGTNQAASRQSFKLTLTRTHIRFERLASSTATALVFVDKDTPDVGFSQGVVQFGHHSYNPTKDGSGVPATWHWNNFSVSPGVPFTMSPLPFRYMDKAGSLTTTAGMLRFGAICQVKLDGKILTPQVPTVHNEHFNSYFVPVTAGTHKLEFADDGWYTQSYGCFASGFNVWSTGGSSAPVSTATPVKTATLAPTKTATATATRATTTPATPTPTKSVPTATPTKTPATVTPPPVQPARPVITASASTGSATHSRQSLTATVKSSTQTVALVDVEVYSPSGAKVYQKVYDNQSFSAGVSRIFSSYWSIPKSAERGTYTVKVGVFGTNWSSLMAWNDSAAIFVVK
jgi:hypothetical protein